MPRPAHALALGLAVALGAAAGCDQPDPLVSTIPEDPDVRPAQLLFGAVPLGESATDSVVVTNRNGGALELTSLRVEGADRVSFSVSPQPLRIEGLRTAQVPVTFAPGRLGEISANLEIFHSESPEPIVIRLAGTGTSAGPSPCVDADMDGFFAGCPEGRDCDDLRDDVHPGAPEVCDGRDNDCNDLADDGLRGPRFVDADEDGYGTGTATVVDVCPVPAGYAEVGGDCDDGAFGVNPGASEVCNGVDDDCANGVDDGLAFETFYRDADNDTYGATDSSTVACAAPAGFVARGGDCDDGEMAVNPAQAEVCNGVDDDCANGIDDGLAAMTLFRDADMDTFGDAATATVACQPIPGWVLDDTDCDDGEMTANPAGTEVCVGGIDEDCDTLVDDLDPDCQCADQDDCGLNTNGLACPRTGAAMLQCRPLCRDPGDCGVNEACRPLPGTTAMGFCLPGVGAVPDNGACQFTSDCADGICFGGACKRVCQTQADCTGGDTCGVALYDTAEIGGAAQLRQTMLCQPLAGRAPLGTGNCLLDPFNADTGQCASTHCELLPWLSQQAAQPTCAQLCAGSGDCGGQQVCGLVYHSFAETPPIPSTQEAAGRFHDGIMGCYTPVFFNGVSWINVPPGVGGLGAPCTASSARAACRSHQCAQFAPIANRCTDFCDDDTDCQGPGTMNWRCQVAELSLTGVFLQSLGVADITKFTLVGICAP